MAKAWSAWYDAVLPHLPGLPAGAPADFIIKRAAIEFFDRSLAWRVAIPDFNATADTPTYVLAAPVLSTLIVKVLDLRFQGKELTPMTPDELREMYGAGVDWRSRGGAAPSYWTSEYPNQVRVVPYPTTTTVNALDGWAAVKPADDAATVPDEIWREYHDDVAMLARARAMEVPKKPYSNPQRAEALLAKVDTRIGLVALQREKGASRAPMRTKTHWI